MRYSHGLLMAGALALGLSLALPVDLGWAAGGGGGGSSSSGGSSGGKSNKSSSNSESALYADAKEAEMHKFNRAISPQEHEWYL